MDDDDNDISESDTVDCDEVSAAHSRKCKASCIRMFDREDVKDHSLKVQELQKGGSSVHNGMFAEDWGWRDQKGQEKKDSFQICAQQPLRGLQKYNCFGLLSKT